MSQERVCSRVTGRGEGGRRAGSTGSTPDTDTGYVVPVLDPVTDHGAALTGGEPQRRGRREAPVGAVAGGADPLRVLRRWRAPVNVRRLPFAGDGGRGVDGRRLGPAEDAGDAEGRVLVVANGPERLLADVEAERVVVVQTAACLAVFLLEEDLRRRRATPGALELQVLLGHHGHFDLRLARHRRRSHGPPFADSRTLHCDLGCPGCSVTKDTRLTSVTRRDRSSTFLRTVPSEARRLHRRGPDGRGQSIRQANRF